jgi:hypothetical protein
MRILLAVRSGDATQTNIKLKLKHQNQTKPNQTKPNQIKPNQTKPLPQEQTTPNQSLK